MPGLDNQAFAAALGVVRVDEVQSNPARETRAAQSIEIRRAVGAIRERFRDPLTLSSIARQSGMSRSALAARFAIETGRTVHQYLTDVRIANAMDELRGGGKIDAVALGVGFRSAAKFYRDFRRRTGMTPAAYRKRFTAVSASAQLAPERPPPGTASRRT